MNIEQVISKLAGQKAEITIRGDREFTFSFESVNVDGAEKIKVFFGNQAKFEIDHDEECGTFVYVNV